MNELILIRYAEKFLQNKNISFIMPAKIGRRKPGYIEIIFDHPEANNPNIVIDPPDIRVWVNIDTGEVKLIPQL